MPFLANGCARGRSSLLATTVVDARGGIDYDGGHGGSVSKVRVTLVNWPCINGENARYCADLQAGGACVDAPGSRS